MADIIEVKPADITDIAFFAINYMRQEDIEECWVLSRRNEFDTLMESYEQSCECYIVEINSKVACVFGLQQYGNSNYFWLLFSRYIERLPISFFKQSKEYLDGFLKKYGRIENYTLPENTFVLKWLKWLGFNIEPLEPIGVDGVLVHRFWKEA